MNEELSALLILADLMESHHPWLVPLGLLFKTFHEFFVGSLSPYSGPDAAGLLSLQGWQGSHLHHHHHQCLGQGQSWQPPHGLQPHPAVSSSFASHPARKGFSQKVPQQEALPPPCPTCFLHLCHLKWSNSQSDIMCYTIIEVHIDVLCQN